MGNKLLLQLNISWEENQSHLHNLQRIMLNFSYNIESRSKIDLPFWNIFL